MASVRETGLVECHCQDFLEKIPPVELSSLRLQVHRGVLEKTMGILARIGAHAAMSCGLPVRLSLSEVYWSGVGDGHYFANSRWVRAPLSAGDKVG